MSELTSWDALRSHHQHPWTRVHKEQAARTSLATLPQSAAAHSAVWQATSNDIPARRARKLRLLKLAMVHAAIVALSACGGGYGGGGGGYQNPAPPPAQMAEGQFTEEVIEGLGFRTDTAVEGKTDASGKFQF